jgi:hypothetical protein
MAKRTFPLVIILLCFPFLSRAQVNYKVIKVNGSIVYVRSGNPMTQGDVFPENEDLSFGSPTSRAAVINPEKGRFILQPDNPGDLANAKTHFLPGMNNISTRGGAFNNVQDLQNHFRDTLVLLKKTSLAVNPYRFPMDEEHFFFLTYTYSGEQINKKLGFDENQLVLNREEVLMVDEVPIVSPDKPEMTLSYYTPDGVTGISTFNMFFPDPESLTFELSVILEGREDLPYATKVNEISGYLYEFYGKPDKKDVMQYLEDEFGITGE